MVLSPSLVFADADGVVNHNGVFRAQREAGVSWPDPAQWVDRACVARLDALCREVNASVVVSSGWRKYLGGWKGVAAVFERCGLSVPIIGGTPDYSFGRDHEEDFVQRVRWSEILAWFDWNGVDPESLPWVAFDDVELGGAAAQHFVKTDLEHGLTPADVEKARGLLTRS